MTLAEYLVNVLYEKGVTDVFGIPGGVIIDLLYAFDASKIRAHLSYHEQAAAFEACGYAQVEFSLGVAYATRGPGFTNFITGIADAYADSLPVLFITAHTGNFVGHEQRFEKEQELDTVDMVKYITKYAAYIDDIAEAQQKINNAIKNALTGRKGPVFLDISASLWNKEVQFFSYNINNDKNYFLDDKVDKLTDMLRKSHRPIFLLGDGVTQSWKRKEIVDIINASKIPVISSRGSQDYLMDCDYYFGYIGSHGIRYANVVFQKADLVIVIGNRLAFPVESESYGKALLNKKIIRFEIDEDELKRKINNSLCINCDIDNLSFVLNKIIKENDSTDWINTCFRIKNKLINCDMNSITYFLDKYLKVNYYKCIIADVGNNEFWLSRAYEYSKSKSRILYSKSFGTLGCGIGKAIGAYYYTGKSVLLVVGDQGFHLNIQELQLISNEKIPIHILIINNNSSGMIKDREICKGYYIHTTSNSGFKNPRFDLLANAYGIAYKKISDIGKIEIEDSRIPMILEYNADESLELFPKLLKGDPIDDMYPKLNEEILNSIRKM